METLQETNNLKHQLHAKCKQIKKAEKQAKIQHLRLEIAETDHQLDLLCKILLHSPWQLRVPVSQW